MMKSKYVCIAIVAVFCLAFVVGADEPILVINPYGHSSQISALMFTPDGSRLISTSYDKTIRIWDVSASLNTGVSASLNTGVETGDLISTLRHQIGTGHDGEIHAAALSPDGTVLAVGGIARADEDTGVPVYLFDINSGAISGVLPGHSDVVMALEFSPDGRWLVSAADKAIRIWDLARIGAVPVLQWESESKLFDIALSPDATRLVSGHVDTAVRIWELPPLASLAQTAPTEQPMTPRWVLNVHDSVAGSVAWSSDGRYMISGDFNGNYVLWDSATEMVEHSFDPMEGAGGAVFSPDGQHVVVSNGNKAQVYSFPRLHQELTFTKHVSPILNSAFSNGVTAMALFNNEIIATAGGNAYDIYIWDLKTGDVKTRISGQGTRVQAVGVNAALDNETLGDTSLLVAFGNTSGGMYDRGSIERAFDFAEMRLFQTLPTGIVFSSPQTSYQGQSLQYTPGHQNPDDWYTLRIMGGGTIINSAIDGWVRSYTFTPDGNVVVGSSHVLRLHNSDGTVLREFVGHTGEVWDVSVSADGSLLVSGSDDQTIKLWNLQTGECLATLFIARDNEWICWTSRGYYAASAGGEKYIGWQINQGREQAALYYPASVFRNQRYHPELIKATIRLRSFEAASEVIGDTPQPPQTSQKRSVILPPLVEWLEPQAPTIETRAPSIRVRAKIRSDYTVNENDITTLKLLVNGRTQATEDQIRLIGSPSPFYKEFEYDVSLTKGKNDISIFAATRHAGAPSEKRVVLRDVQGDEWLKSDLYLVSVGISDYPVNDLKLTYADDDARSITQLFQAQAGKLYRDVYVKDLYDADATEANIIAALEWLERQTKQGDVAVVFIAAHGFRSGNENFYYILPVDGNPDQLRSTGVDWGIFAEILGNLPARVLLLLDTCHSGQLGANLLASGPTAQRDNTEALRTLASDEYGVIILAASTGQEASQEHQNWGHGAFTASLLEALEQGLADYPPKPDGIIYLRELDLYVDYRVRELTEETQHPTTQKPSTISRFPIVQIK